MTNDRFAESVRRLLRHIDTNPEAVQRELTPEVCEALVLHRNTTRARPRPNQVAEDIYARRIEASATNEAE